MKHFIFLTACFFIAGFSSFAQNKLKLTKAKPGKPVKNK
jgi:hypothetical protein